MGFDFLFREPVRVLAQECAFVRAGSVRIQFCQTGNLSLFCDSYIIARRHDLQIMEISDGATALLAFTS